jgi:hypothetical protein
VLSLTVKGERELRQVAAALRRGKGTLRQELTKAFRTAGDTTLRRVKRNIETMQIRGRRKGGRAFRENRAGNNLRRRISRVTELDISTSATDPRVRFEVHNERLADIKAQRVPWHLDTGKAFRHPIMGNRSAWAASVGKPWFYDEIKKDRAIFEAECQDAIDRTIDRIQKG